jgi:hypothetical protein
MIRTVEAIIDEDGQVRLLEEVRLPGARRAFVTILEEAPRRMDTTLEIIFYAVAGPNSRLTR